MRLSSIRCPKPRRNDANLPRCNGSHLLSKTFVRRTCTGTCKHENTQQAQAHDKTATQTNKSKITNNTTNINKQTNKQTSKQASTEHTNNNKHYQNYHKSTGSSYPPICAPAQGLRNRTSLNPKTSSPRRPGFLVPTAETATTEVLSPETLNPRNATSRLRRAIRTLRFVPPLHLALGGGGLPLL